MKPKDLLEFLQTGDRTLEDLLNPKSAEDLEGLEASIRAGTSIVWNQNISGAFVSDLDAYQRAGRSFNEITRR